MLDYLHGSQMKSYIHTYTYVIHVYMSEGHKEIIDIHTGKRNAKVGQKDLKMLVLKIGIPRNAGSHQNLEETTNGFVLGASGISGALLTPCFHPTDIHFGLLISRDSEGLNFYHLLFLVCTSLSWQFPGILCSRFSEPI